MKWWRQRWAAARPTDAGEAIAAIIVSAGVLLVIMGVANSAWSNIMAALQPPIVTIKDANDLDLIAQRGMNLAAWIMALATITSTILAAISLALIWANLVEARKVSAEAARSTAAAEAAVREAQNTTMHAQALGIRQLRSYLLVESAKVGVSHFGAVALEVSVTNSGQSPARWVSVQASLDIELRHRGEVLSAARGVDITLWLNDIKSGGQMRADTGWNPMLEKFANEGKVVPYVIRLYGNLRYVDVFDQRHIEGFQFHLTGADVPHQRMLDLTRQPEAESSFIR